MIPTVVYPSATQPTGRRNDSARSTADDVAFENALAVHVGPRRDRTDEPDGRAGARTRGSDAGREQLGQTGAETAGAGTTAPVTTSEPTPTAVAEIATGPSLAAEPVLDNASAASTASEELGAGATAADVDGAVPAQPSGEPTAPGTDPDAPAPAARAAGTPEPTPEAGRTVTDGADAAIPVSEQAVDTGATSEGAGEPADDVPNQPSADGRGVADVDTAEGPTSETDHSTAADDLAGTDEAADRTLDAAATGGDPPGDGQRVSLEGQAAVPDTAASAVDGDTPPVVPVGVATADQSNTPTVTATTPTTAPPIPDQIVTHVTPLIDGADGTSEVTIELSPDDLGRVQLEVTLDDGVLHVRLHAEEPGSRRLLAASMAELRDALADAGLRAGDLEVSDRSDARSDRHRNDPDRSAQRAEAASGVDDAGTRRTTHRMPDATTPESTGAAESVDVLL